MNKIAAIGIMPVYDKTPLKILFPGNRRMFIGPMVLWLLYARCKSGVTFITKTSLRNEDPLTPHFYIVKLGLRGVYIIIPPVYEVYRGYIVFAFSVCVCMFVNFF